VDSYDLESLEAYRRLQENPAARWASGLAAEPAAGTAWHRMREPMFRPLIRPAFRIDPDDRIFAIGSCFARNVEGALRALSFRVDSMTDEFDEFAVQRPVDAPPGFVPKATAIGFMNKYNTESIFNELLWALEPGAEFPVEALLPMPSDLWIDPQTSPVFGFENDLATTLRRRRILTNVMRRIPACRIVVITLGLVETFLDLHTGLYTNSTPRLDVDPERFRFRVLSHEQVVDGLERIHGLLAAHGHPDVEIVVTVSPVPLDATFTGEDIVVANTFSKSLLRAAAGHWAGAHENVHYFPSYEIVMNSPREHAWEIDGRHVRHELVQHVMQLFTDAHLAPAEPAAVGAESS
jgi:hypothetical protein